MRRLAPLAALLLALACADNTPGPTAPRSAVADETRPSYNASAEVRPGVSLDRILTERSDDGPFLAALRPPRLQTVRDGDGTVPPDSTLQMDYDGLALLAHTSPGGPTRIQSLRVTSSEYGTASGLSVGESLQNIETVLGEPISPDPGVQVYQSPPGDVSELVMVTYEVDGDGVARASEILWAFDER